MAPMYEKPVRLLIKDLVAQKGMKPGEILQSALVNSCVDNRPPGQDLLYYTATVSSTCS